ncbi:MAG: hypothetical protein H6742_03965 [Alphaproteobacteria bacterium]|nr:hypothetical protein [Alphaproteobacteria bacterium]
MPDLLTHGAAGLLVGWGLLGRRAGPWTPVFALGCLLPDALARVPGILTGEIHTKLHPLPDLLLYGFEPLHQPAGMALAAAALAAAFADGQRLRAFVALFGGMSFHLALDLLQHHEGAGHLLLFPLSDQSCELGLVGSEDSVYVAVPLALMALVLGWWRRRSQAPRA